MNSGKIQPAAIERLFEKTTQEAPRSAQQIEFFLESCGYKLGNTISFDFDGLQEVETGYRWLCKSNGFSADLTKDMLEMLIVYFVGEVLIRTYGGEWFAHKGKKYTISPIIVRLAGLTKGLDVAALCKDLDSKRTIAGARDGKALVAFCKKAKSLSVI